MSNEGIVKADGEFLQGHFEEAKELYAHALDQLEAAYPEQHSELAACLQKLGDTNYVLDRFSEAEQIFTRLLNVLEQNDGPVQDIVTTLLKLAKNKEKLENIDEAKGMYERAAELGESSLASGHFLLSSIFTSYAAMLTRTKADPERLSVIEGKLKQYARKRTANDDGDESLAGEEGSDGAKDETTADDITLPQPKVNEEEINAMRSKLRKAADKRQTDDPVKAKKPKLRLQVPEATTGDTSQKTGETEGAAAPPERKWLRKDKLKNPKSDADKAKNRTKLRKSMLKGGPSAPPPAAPGEEAEAQNLEGGSPVEPQAPAKPGLSEAARKFIGGKSKSASAVPPAYRPSTTPYVPAEQDQPLKKQQRTRGLKLGQTNTASFEFDRQGRMTRSSNVVPLRPDAGPSFAPEESTAPLSSDPTAAIAQSQTESSQSISKFTTKQEGAEPTESMTDLSPKLKETDSKADQSREVTARPLDMKRFVIPGAVAVLVACWCIFMLFTLRTQPVAETSWWSRHAGITYSSADAQKSVSFTNGKAELAAGSEKLAVPVRYWEGNLRDEMDFLGGAFDKSNWVIESPEGLCDESGIILYTADAPEIRVVNNMRGIARVAQKFYMDNGRYPQYVSELTPNDTYKNPLTNSMEAPQMCSSVGKELVSSSAKTEFETKLEEGAPFTDESKAQPGAIRTYGVLAHPEYSGESNNYKWLSQSFFVHGYDRLGALIGGGEKRKILLLTLKDGRDLTPNATPRWFNSSHPSNGLCLAKVPRPTPYSVLFKYVMTLIALAAGIGGFKFYTTYKLKTLEK